MSTPEATADESPSGAADSAAAWRNDAADLFDQQLWCFGYDIRRAEGNLLIELGCERIAAPELADCVSCYQVTLPTGERLTLRGFGLLCEDLANSCAVFLHRSGFRVGWYERGIESLPWLPADVMRSVAVPPDASEHAARLLSRAIEWVGEYERAVTERLGADYRIQGLGERDRPPAIDPTEMAPRWRRLASEVVREPGRISAKRSKRKSKRRAPKPFAST